MITLAIANTKPTNQSGSGNEMKAMAKSIEDSIEGKGNAEVDESVTTDGKIDD